MCIAFRLGTQLLLGSGCTASGEAVVNARDELNSGAYSYPLNMAFTSNEVPDMELFLLDPSAQPCKRMATSDKGGPLGVLPVE